MATETTYYRIKSYDDFDRPIFTENFTLGNDGEFTITFYNTNEKALMIDNTYFIVNLNGRSQTKGRYSLHLSENWVFIGITNENSL